MLIEYITVSDNLIDGYPIVEYPDVGPDNSFTRGKILADNLNNGEPLFFETECPANEYPGHFYASTIPVFSKRFVEVINLAGIDNYQLYPAILRNKEHNVVWDDFYAFNVIGIIDAVNEDESEYDIIMPGSDDGIPPFVDYRKIVLDPAKTKGHLMFREAKQPSLIFFHTKLRDLLKQNAPEEGWGLKVKPYESRPS